MDLARAATDRRVGLHHTHIIDRCNDAARAIGPRSTARLELRILRRPAGLGVVVDTDHIAPIGNPGQQGAFRCHAMASPSMGAIEARRTDPVMILLGTNTCSAAQGPHREAFID